jgi:hypothetical protein
MNISTRRLAGRAVLALGAAGLLLGPAAAYAATIAPIEYDASGTTHIAKTGSDIVLGPTKLHTDLDVDTFDFTGSLPLPGTRTTFKVAGFVPVSANVDFIPVGQVQGHINLEGLNAEVTSTAQYYVRLSNVKAAGFPTFVGSTCKTKQPVVIPADTPEGQGFDLTAGGTLQGTYTIGSFQNCGLMTGLINTLVPGPGNTASIEVSNGVFQ